MIKSLTEHEYNYVKDTYYYLEEDEKFLYYAAYSILQVAGDSVLQHRAEAIPMLLEILKDWPSEYITKLGQKMGVFRDKIVKAHNLLEPYTYTRGSRMRWFAYKGKLLNDPQLTGWPGTENLSLSSVQLSWITLNELEDTKQGHERLLDAAIFIAASLNPNAASVQEKEIQKRREEQTRRDEVLDMILGNKLSEDDLKSRDLVMTPEQRRSMSNQEIVEELRRMQAGEKDRHDVMVEEYERELKRTYIRSKKQKEEVILETIQERDLMPDIPQGITTRSRVIDDVSKYKPDTTKIVRPHHKIEEVNPFPEKLMQRFSAMGKLSPEEEEYLTKDVYREIADKHVPQRPEPQYKTGRVIKDQTLEAFKKLNG